MGHGEPCIALNAGSLSADNKVGDDSLLHPSSILCNGYPEKLINSSSYGLINSTIEHSLVLQDERNEQRIRSFPNMAVDVRSDAARDKGESSIIFNMLSMDFEPREYSLTPPQNLAKLLGDNPYSQCDPFKKINSWKVQNNSQSRFSFARQEESKIQTFDALPCIGVGSGHSVTSNKHSVVSRAQITAPPGGMEFNDPAILAVGKGRFEGSLNSTGDMKSHFVQQFNHFENEAGLQLLMPQSLSQQQNLQFSD
ncbi:hypothetical protein K1719_044466 [Acacia pycnantha]|nr:hypothetical protein K1719_044466 [Acacia pycnantha]